MELVDVAGHVAFGLIALSYLVREILWLRIISLVASFAAIAYNHFAPDRPLWLVIGWNVVFIAVNVGHVMWLLRERRGLEFSDEEKELRETIFPMLPPLDFARLLRLGTWRDAGNGEALVNAGQESSQLYLIYRGAVAVEKEGEPRRQLGDGAFVGEVSFLTGSGSAATVRTVEPTRLLAWDKDSLHSLTRRNATIQRALQSAISCDLAEKLKR